MQSTGFTALPDQWRSYVTLTIKSVAVSSVVITLFAASMNLLSSYSYWWDELYTITASRESFMTMLRYVFGDVHPPFYNILMWVWVRLFGDAEFFARAFSWLAVSGSIFAIIMLARTFQPPIRYFILIIYGCTWTVPYYAQEVRSYALLLFLSCITLYLFITRRNFWGLIASTIALGLTHFFGTVMAGLVLLWVFIDNIRDVKKTCASVAAAFVIVLWPLAMIIFGNATSRTGGSFWITSDGPLDTISKAMQAAFPLLERDFWSWFWTISSFVPGPRLFKIVLLLGVIAATARILKPRLVLSTSDQAPLIKSLYLTLGILTIPLLIDLHTPISTTRNFIVVIPPAITMTGIVLGIIARGSVFRSGMMTALVCYYFAASQPIMWAQLQAKWRPHQNWKEASRFAIDHINENSDINVYYLQRGEKVSSWTQMNHNYYLNVLGHPEINLAPLFADDVDSLTAHWLILAGHSEKEMHALFNRLEEARKTYSVYYPRQSWRESVAVIYSDEK